MMALILAADDDPIIRRLLEVNLEMEGYDVVLAEDGAIAVEKAREHQPDVILLDVMMPNMDGVEACRQLKADDATKDIPVVFLSARARDADVTEGTRAGATAYITKPFDPIDLLDLLADLVADLDA